MMTAAMPKAPSSARHGGAFETSPVRKFGEVSIALPQLLSPANAPVPRNGTALAFNYLTLGVPADSTCKHGGARNSASRESHELTATQLENILAASRHADAIGLPFNRMFTVHWQAAGPSLEAMAKATGRFIDLLTRALARKGYRTACAWVHESGDGKGGHLHLLAHVPPMMAKPISRLQIGWLRLITGRAYRKKVIRSDAIGGRLGLETGNPPLHAVNLQVALGYVCKGASQAILHAAGLNREHEPGGRIIGKRCGTSQNIGAKARREHGGGSNAG